MTEAAEEVEQLIGSLEALRAEHAELRRRVAVSDEEIDLLQVEVAREKRRWYRDPGILVATLALVVSVGAFIASQVNISSDRQIQDRNRLSNLIDQLPKSFVEAAQDPNSSADALPGLIANSAADLIDKLGPEAATAEEIIEVAEALGKTSDLPRAKRLAIVAKERSTTFPERLDADRTIASIDFVIGDAASGRDVLREIISEMQLPQNELGSAANRDFIIGSAELLWADLEFTDARNCQGAMEHIGNARQRFDRLAQNNIVRARKAYLDGLAMAATADCTTAGR